MSPELFRPHQARAWMKIDHLLPAAMTTPLSTKHQVPRKRRRAHHKVKTGCQACKIRQYKCDEQKPICRHCMRHSTHCSYPVRKAVSAREMLSMSAIQPSPTRNLPSSPSRDLDFDDLELLHQYITSTCIATAQLPHVTAKIQTTVPLLAQDYPFVMRGILAKAAVHLSWLRPAQKTRYSYLAAKHQSLALPAFRSAVQTIDVENYRALIEFSFTLVWCSFAWYETLSSSNPEQQQQNSHCLPSWFYLLSGSCLLLKACAAWTGDDMYLLPHPENVADFESSADNARLLSLTSALTAVVDSPACEAVLTSLREAFAQAAMRHRDSPLRRAINYWMAGISEEYVELLHAGEPWALVVLAHFCILISRSESRWFMKGHAGSPLNSIVGRLPAQWRHWTQWPCREVESELAGLNEEVAIL